MAQLIGSCLHGMMIGSSSTTAEKDTQNWLTNHIFFNGLEQKPDEIGMYCLYCRWGSDCVS